MHHITHLGCHWKSNNSKKVSEEADHGFENDEYQESRLNILKGDIEPKN